MRQREVFVVKIAEKKYIITGGTYGDRAIDKSQFTRLPFIYTSEVAATKRARKIAQWTHRAFGGTIEHVRLSEEFQAKTGDFQCVKVKSKS